MQCCLLNRCFHRSLHFIDVENLLTEFDSYKFSGTKVENYKLVQRYDGMVAHLFVNLMYGSASLVWCVCVCVSRVYVCIPNPVLVSFRYVIRNGALPRQCLFCYCVLASSMCRIWTTWLKRLRSGPVRCSDRRGSDRRAESVITQKREQLGGDPVEEVRRLKMQCHNCKALGTGGSSICQHGRRRAQCHDCKALE
jgi:hypothetical protein